MGITMSCEGCFEKFEATSKEDTLPDEQGYVLCPRCKKEELDYHPMGIAISNEVLENVILGIAPWVGVKPPNRSQFTKEYNKRWKAFARILRKIKEYREL
tara:strand:+ start:709 stop:1008 length:300 start_codon:yes stop_codon:yes gene_type:complete